MKKFFFKENGEARFLPSNVAVVVATVALATHSPWGFLPLDSKELLSVVVPVAGTLVALVLIAVQLAQSAMDNFSSAATQLLKARKPVPDVVSFLKKQAVFKRQDAGATLGAMYFSIASLVAGLLGELLPSDRMNLVSLSWSWRELASILSCTTLLAAVGWLLRALRSSVDFDEVDSIIALLDQPLSVPPPAPVGANTVTVAASPVNPHPPIEKVNPHPPGPVTEGHPSLPKN